MTTVTNGWSTHQKQPQPRQVHLELPQRLSRSCPSGAVKTTVPRSCGCTCSTWGPLRYQIYPVSMYLRGPPKCRPEVPDEYYGDGTSIPPALVEWAEDYPHTNLYGVWRGLGSRCYGQW